MSVSSDPELSLREVLSILSGWKYIIALAALIAVSLAALAAYLLPKQYDANILFSPVSNTSTNGLLGGLSSVASQFGGLASLAGLSAPTDSAKAESIAVLQSETLTEEYISNNGLLPILYADLWDSSLGKWKPMNTEKIPTLWKANQYFTKKIRTVSTDAKSGLVTLRITWRDPQQAAQWANGLVKMTNDFRRDKAIAEAERNIGYLTAEAMKSDVVGVKQAIYSILQTEISKSMLARGNEEYALKVIDPASAPEKPSSVHPLLLILGALLGTLAASCALAFLRAAMPKPNSPRQP